MLTSLPDFQRYALAIAGRAGLSLRWEKTGSVPRIDGRTLYVPFPEWDAGEDGLFRTKAAITHEVGGHYHYTDFNAPENEKISMGSKLGILWNLFEDGRIEDLSSAVYAGDRELFHRADCYYMALLSAGKMSPAAYAPPVLVSWTVYCMHKMRDNPALSANVDELLAIGRGIDGYEVLLEKVLKSGILPKYDAACLVADKVEGTKATLEVARMVWDSSADEDKQEEEKKSGKGKKGEGEGEATEGGEGDKESDSEDAEGKGKKKVTFVKWEDVLKSSHGTKEGKPSGARIVYDEYDDDVHGSFNAHPIYKYVVHPVSESDNGFVTKATAIALKSVGFTNRVRTQLQIATRTRWQYGQKKGMLNKGSLFRVTIPNAGSYGERVFKNQTHQNDLDIALFVLLDMSGSMCSRDKIQHGMAASALLSDALGNALHIPTEIAGFSEWHDGPEIMQVRGFHERNVGKDTVLRRIGAYTHKMRENTDGEAILWAYDRIKNRSEKRKLIVVLSDGQPAGGYGRGDIYPFTKQVIKDIEKSHVEIVGIGIMDDTVKEFYASNAVIDDASKLEEALLSVVKSRILGG